MGHSAGPEAAEQIDMTATPWFRVLPYDEFATYHDCITASKATRQIDRTLQTLNPLAALESLRAACAAHTSDDVQSTVSAVMVRKHIAFCIGMYAAKKIKFNLASLMNGTEYGCLVEKRSEDCASAPLRFEKRKIQG